MSVLDGVGPEAPVVTNEQGGKQSLSLWRFDLMDPPAMFTLGRILDVGARRYGDDNWRKIPMESHLNKALVHIYAHLGGDVSDDHLGHAFCRMMMALAVAMSNGYEPVQHE